MNEIDIQIKLMELYANEWNHRDSTIIKHIYTYFFATLITMVLPYSDILGINLLNNLPKWIFPSIGILLDIIFLIFGKSQALRLKAIGDSYVRINNMLPKQYQRVKLEEKSKSLFYKRMTDFLIYTMFILLLIIGIVILVISLNETKINV